MTNPDTWTLIGVPTSAGAFAPGQEKAPAGLPIVDAGDSPTWRWQPDRANPAAQNVDVGVVAQARATERLGQAGRLGLVYLDMHPDLSVPDGALDWMRMAHLLGEPGTLLELADISPRTPMLSPEDVVFLGDDRTQMTDHERARFDVLDLYGIPVADIRPRPATAAQLALDRRSQRCDRILVHFDVDVVDFVDAPLSENDGRNIGLTLDQTMAALTTLCASTKLAGLTITELNPDHGAEDGSDLARFIVGLTSALAATLPPVDGAARSS